MAINLEAFLDVLPEIGYGMLGIFIVTGVIIGITTILNRIWSNKKE
jgi:hypothetical protein